MKALWFGIVFVTSLLAVLVSALAAGVGDVAVGVGFVYAPYDLPPAEQETILGQMERAGVRVVRCSIPHDDKGLDFAQRIHSHGIKIIWMLGETPAEGTPWPRPPQGFKDLWKDYPLSAADAERFRAKFEPFLARVEAKGIVFEAFELGNEINWAGFNADFNLPGEGRVLGLRDLTNDSEGKKVAQGYLKYIKHLSVLKDVRDHSKLNQQTPIISAGLADLGGSSWTRTKMADAVSISATLDFLRANGLDQLVDGYGIHYYPSSDISAARAHIEQNGVEECQATGSAKGKPCWITEWNTRGGSQSTTCPVDDRDKVKIFGELRDYYGRLASQGRLKGLIFYVWHGDWHSAKENTESAFRCGSLTESGRLALAPL